MDNISSKSSSTICHCEVWVLASERYAFASFCVRIKFLRLVFELLAGWSIASSTRLMEWWLAFFLQEEHFLLDSWFSLNFLKIIETAHQASGFLGTRASAWAALAAVALHLAAATGQGHRFGGLLNSVRSRSRAGLDSVKHWRVRAVPVHDIYVYHLVCVNIHTNTYTSMDIYLWISC